MPKWIFFVLLDKIASKTQFKRGFKCLKYIIYLVSGSKTYLYSDLGILVNKFFGGLGHFE